MMYGYGGAGWAWMTIMPLLWVALIGLVVWAAVRLAHGPTTPTDRGSGRGSRETPEEILDRRFASGEIDAETYAGARRQLSAFRPTE